MLTELCKYTRSWFVKEIFYGQFTISGGILTRRDGSALPLASGQYFCVTGSLFNDGVHKLGNLQDVLVDEQFTGTVWSMAVPPAFEKLAQDIAAWREKYEAVDSQAMSPFNSESYGGYSYSKSGGGSGGSGSGANWQSVFSARIGPWRKI